MGVYNQQVGYLRVCIPRRSSEFGNNNSNTMKMLVFFLAVVVISHLSDGKYICELRQ